MKCPTCGIGTLAKDTRDVMIDGRLIKALEGEYCDHCNEIIMNGIESDKIFNAFRRDKDGRKE